MKFLPPNTLRLAIALFIPGLVITAQPVRNWPAPPSWTHARQSGVKTTLDLTDPMPFIGLAPCRIADTRGNGFTGAYGPPALAGGSPRDFTLAGQCGIPLSAGAVSLNITVTGTTGPGFVLVYPEGGSQPVVSTLNYVAGDTVANAAIVPLGTGGGVTVILGVSGGDLIIDTNGYYYDNFLQPPPLPSGRYFGITGDYIDGGVLFGWNQEATGAAAFGVNALSSSTGAGSAGLQAKSVAQTGVTYGVLAVTESVTNHAAAVRGLDSVGVVNASAAPTFSAGVIGEGQNGVIGRTSTSLGYGVAGTRENGIGNNTAYGALGYFDGTTNFSVYGIIGDIGCVACAKSFIEPHSTDASKVVRYISLEGNEAGTYFRGTARTSDGTFVIPVPEDFRMVTDEEGLTVQLTPVGAPATMYVVSEDLHQIVVHSSKDVQFHYLVQGIRPRYKNYEAIQTSRAFFPQSPDDRMQEAWPDSVKQTLIANGTYNEDGTVNMKTAERVGLLAIWKAASAAPSSRARASAGQGKQ